MSSYNYQNVSPLQATAGGTIEAFRVVEGTLASCTAANAIADLAIGVSLQSAASGDVISLQTHGIAKITASAAITAGDEVMVTASGSGKVSTSSGATARSVGVAMTAAAADGDIIEVLIQLPNVKGPANS